jgi:hypothetical protein
VQVEGAGDRLAEKHGRGRAGAAGGPGHLLAHQVVPGDVGHHVGGEVVVAQHVRALLAAPVGEVEEERAIPAGRRARRRHVEAVARPPQHLLEARVQRQLGEGGLVVDGQLVE